LVNRLFNPQITVFVFAILIAITQQLHAESPILITKSLTEEELVQKLEVYDVEATEWCSRSSNARWNVQTDTENAENREILNNVTLEYAMFTTTFYNDVVKDLNIEDYKDEKIRRQLKSLKNRGVSALSPERLEQYNEVMKEMDKFYQLGSFCPYNKPDCEDDEKMTLDPEMTEVLASSTDYDELLYVWQGWRNVSGRNMLPFYKKYVELVNEAAEENGFEDFGALWRSSFDDPEFEQTLERLWKEVEPLYDELHTYVRYKLFDLYGE
jgi:peptidyl-dipeptidase A